MKRGLLILLTLILLLTTSYRLTATTTRDYCGDCMEAAQQASTAYYQACVTASGDYDQCDYDSRTLKCAYGATHCSSCSWIDMLIEGSFCLN